MGELIQLRPRQVDRQVSKAQLAAIWRMSPRSIERMMAEGLPSDLIEGARFFWLQEATAWKEERCHVGAAVAAR